MFSKHSVLVHIVEGCYLLHMSVWWTYWGQCCKQTWPHAEESLSNMWGDACVPNCPIPGGIMDAL